jgi:hypothetical protein
VKIVRAKTGSGLVVTGLVLGVTAAGVAGAKEGPSPEIRAFRPVADTYVSEAQPERNFGRLHTLRADGSPVTTVYLRFRLKELSGKITGVTLLLHARAGARTSYQVRRVEQSAWRETRLTYANAPRLSLRYASSKPVRRRSWSAVDVTPFVDVDTQRVSLAITTKSSLGVVFASRESDQGPRLVVRTDTQEREP